MTGDALNMHRVPWRDVPSWTFIYAPTTGEYAIVLPSDPHILRIGYPNGSTEDFATPVTGEATVVDLDIPDAIINLVRHFRVEEVDG